MFDTSALPGWFLALFVLLILWSAVWKAIALWKSARNNALAWFIIFCIFNTAGILDPPAMPSGRLGGQE